MIKPKYKIGDIVILDPEEAGIDTGNDDWLPKFFQAIICSSAAHDGDYWSYGIRGFCDDDLNYTQFVPEKDIICKL